MQHTCTDLVDITPELSTTEMVQFAEKHAALLRQKANVAPLDKLNPYELTEEFNLRIKHLTEIEGVQATDYEHLVSVDAQTWSGAGLPLPDGSVLVLLHPGQTPERATITIMEEVAHAYFEHKPSQLICEPAEVPRRIYDKKNEQEAYWTAAAALLPAKAVAKSVWKRQPADVLADHYGVSIELVQFRIKTMNLWNHHVRQSR